MTGTSMLSEFVEGDKSLEWNGYHREGLMPAEHRPPDICGDRSDAAAPYVPGRPM